MLPLFKSDFSIGKSILNLELPEKTKEKGSDSIFSIALANDFNNVILVEDCLTGFLQAHKNSKSLGLSLIFGLRISTCEDLNADPKETERKDESKIIVFAKNDEGCKTLNRIYSLAFTEGQGRIDYKNLKIFWNDDVLLAIPFYDSFIFNNAMSFGNCIPDLSFTSPVFFLEDNALPFDFSIQNKVKEYCLKNKYIIDEAKSIYYNKKEDLAAFQTYKCICNRSFSSGETGLTNPRLEHCGSAEFSFESWKEKQNEIS